MAEHSFDVVSKCDLQEMDNAVNQAMKEISTRFDFRGSQSRISFDRDKKELSLESDSEAKLQSVIDVLNGKLVKRGLSLRHLDFQKVEAVAGETVRQKAKILQGIPQEKAKLMVASIKEKKYKVQAAIQGDQLRIYGKDKDELQAVITHLRAGAAKWGLELQFTNYQ